MNIFVFTAGNKSAQQHLKDTVEKSVDENILKEYLSEYDFETLKAASQDEGYYCWGATPGPNNERNWNQLQNGDKILSYWNSQYHHISTIIFKTRNNELATKLWGTLDGNTWEFMYFFKKPIEFKTPKSAFFTGVYLQSQYQGFAKIKEEKVNRIIKEFGSLENLLEAEVLSASIINPNAIKQNDMIIQNSIKILSQKGQIILQGPPGTGKTYTAKDIAEQILFSDVSGDKNDQKLRLESTDKFKLIQFHPAYSYEDFVRGIVAESVDNKINYVTKDKVLAKFAKDAYTNLKASTEPIQKVAKETWVKETLDDFRDFLTEKIEDPEEKLMITRKAYISCITENGVRYDADAWKMDGGVPNSDIIKMYLADTTTRSQIKDNTELTKTAKSLSTYWFGILELFRKYILDHNLSPSETTTEIAEKKYVLIIDEINRANLPSVLGELIYALEYRGEKVESMYPIDDDNTLIIPPNLYIIGTMNTSDRSIGHIDYAIRRRFAFIDVLPKVLSGNDFQLDLFEKVSSLFIANFEEFVKDSTVELKLSEHLSEEFRPEDVWLGHSYFITGKNDFKLRIKYEIIPILKEYVKDGILKQSAEPIINAL